ncbi:UDP-4-amino-4,6-dideoxy-N-acetyl-beta-L-altrosamine transaminase [Zunongwangia sp. H14]|uniref:UDP-4-amino-4, 6-dideoxy-N-acetyl-beta-L-altrosamine transaminase n=1 Tax=Zunongwangia sp. H14 TaxID=3240792 RepID=UPI00356202F4
MNNPIPYGRQNITEEDLNDVIETLKSDYLTQGPKIAEFEDAFANYINSKYAVAVANGTAALHLCALALNVKEGDKVITTPITFAASANCVRYCGGEVVFADIDPDTYLLDINKVKALLEAAPKGTYKGIIPVDFAGRAVNMEDFHALAEQYDLWIIEDACHAPGGYFRDANGKKQLCGNGNFANLAIFSFHPVKHIASGEGGMITTNDKDLYERLLELRTHGIVKDDSKYQNSASFAIGLNEEASDSASLNYPNWYMEMQELGFNYRITDFQAALGSSQLKRAEEGLARRREIANTYFQAFKNSEFVTGQSGIIEGHAYHLYILEVENRLGLYNYLRENKILAQIHYIPCHLMPYYQSFGWKVGDLPAAEEYYKACISLPMFPTLTPEEQDFVINKIKDFYNA